MIALLSGSPWFAPGARGGLPWWAWLGGLLGAFNVAMSVYLAPKLGALTLALKHPQQYRSVSAFAPIVAPCEVPWGQKAFSRYLGDHHAVWAEHDACALVRRRPFGRPILVDQGLADNFLEPQLQPGRFEAACAEAGQSLTLRRHAGYDHGYYFIASFIQDHLRHHAAQLAG